MTTIYLRLRNRHYVQLNSVITLGDIAQIIVNEPYEKKLKELVIHHVTKEDKHLIVIDMMRIIKLIKAEISDVEIRSVGNPEIIVEIITKSMSKKTNIIAIAFVWLLLFIGSGLAIMNFHHDVNMQEVHQRLYFLVTGSEKYKPLILQIPYSLGIGIGMVLFFNHVFKKKINEEPSPLEVEMFLYQKNLDHYVVLNENSENRKEN